MQKRNVYSAIIVLFVSFVRIPWSSAVTFDELSENPPPPTVVSDDYQCMLERDRVLSFSPAVSNNILCQTERKLLLDSVVAKRFLSTDVKNFSCMLLKGIGLGFYNYANFYVSLACKFCIAPVHTVIYDILRPLKDTLLVCCKAICLAVTDWQECSVKTSALMKEIIRLVKEKPAESIGIVVECLLPFAGATVYRGVRSISALHKTVIVVDHVKHHKAVVTVATTAHQTVSRFCKRPISWSGVNMICADAMNVFYYSQSYRCYFLIEAHNLVKNAALEVVEIVKRPLQLATIVVFQEPLVWVCTWGDFLEDVRRFFRGLQRRRI